MAGILPEAPVQDLPDVVRIVLEEREVQVRHGLEQEAEHEEGDADAIEDA